MPLANSASRVTSARYAVTPDHFGSTRSSSESILARTTDRIPSAPITTSAVAVLPSAKSSVTRPPSLSWVSEDNRLHGWKLHRGAGGNSFPMACMNVERCTNNGLADVGGQSYPDYPYMHRLLTSGVHLIHRIALGFVRLSVQETYGRR